MLRSSYRVSVLVGEVNALRAQAELHEVEKRNLEEFINIVVNCQQDALKSFLHYVDLIPLLFALIVRLLEIKSGSAYEAVLEMVGKGFKDDRLRTSQVTRTGMMLVFSQLELDVDPGEACRLLSLIVDWALNKGYVYFFNISRDLYYRTLDGSFSAIPRPIFASN